MRFSTTILAALALTGCLPNESEQRRVMGTIAGYYEGDPHISVTIEGTSATIRVRTYGNGCFSEAGTDVEVDGMEALIVPYDYNPGCPQRDLLLLEHTAIADFEMAGTAVIRIKGLDDSDLSAPDFDPDTLVVTRTVELE